MDAKYQVPRGTFDLMNDDVNLWQQTEAIIRKVCALYGYQEVRTPIFEHTEVFKGENDSSDMVNKEMYTFTDNGNRSLTLRPEGTKGIVRAFVEHKLYGNTAEFPKKLYYIGPMFRYDRPQKGRYRQFHQFGVEAIGANNPMLDVETIALGWQVGKEMGIKNMKVLINSLGDKESRLAYRQALKDYFEPFLSTLCPDCQRRYQQNPLRILDCKVDRDSECFQNVPSIQDYLNEASREYFQKVLKGLDDLGIDFEVNSRLVRGLDYYTNTVFEVVPVTDGGQQATVYGGGQYDGLVESFGGGPLCGVGFGMGIERLINLAVEQGAIKPQPFSTDAYIIGLGDVSSYAVNIAQNLRANGISAETDYLSRSMKAQFKSADRLHAKAILIVGEDEMNSRTVTIKNVQEKTQATVSYDEVLEAVKAIVK